MKASNNTSQMGRRSLWGTLLPTTFISHALLHLTISHPLTPPTTTINRILPSIERKKEKRGSKRDEVGRRAAKEDNMANAKDVGLKASGDPVIHTVARGGVLRECAVWDDAGATAIVLPLAEGYLSLTHSLFLLLTLHPNPKSTSASTGWAAVDCLPVRIAKPWGEEAEKNHDWASESRKPTVTRTRLNKFP